MMKRRRNKNLRVVNEPEDPTDKIVEELIKELRRSIKECRQIANVSIKNYCYAYETAYPHLIQLYWYGCALLRKLNPKNYFK